MDLLHSGSVGGFCIVSSDSDYTRLAMRIREGGMFVMGVGRSNTPKAFVNACEVFVYTENLSPQKNRDSHQERNRAAEWTKLMKQAIDMANQDQGWALLANVGSNLRKLDPAFDSRTYGHSQLSQLVKSRQDTFEVEEKSPVRVRVRS